MSRVTSHVLDTASGKPARGINVALYYQHEQSWHLIGSSITNQDGRVEKITNQDLPDGIYKLSFETGSYYEKTAIPAFYPTIEITFRVRAEEHYHVPLLLSPFGYSTYRGS